MKIIEKFAMKFCVQCGTETIHKFGLCMRCERTQTPLNFFKRLTKTKT